MNEDEGLFDALCSPLINLDGCSSVATQKDIAFVDLDENDSDFDDGNVFVMRDGDVFDKGGGDNNRRRGDNKHHRR